MNTPGLANRQRFTKISSEWTLDAVWMTNLDRWMIGTDGERERERERGGDAFRQLELMLQIIIHTIFMRSN